MGDSKVTREGFIAIQGWMVTDLQLKGNELLIYACIYGFSQAEDQTFSGSLQYLADWTNSTRRGVLKNLQSLIEKGYLVKKESTIKGVKVCEYRTVDSSLVVNKVHGGMEQSSPGVVNKVHGGGEQSSPNNIEDNIDENIDDKKERGKETSAQQIVDLYNQICRSYPKLRTLSSARLKAIKARLRKFSLNDFRELFEKAEDSDFLKGSNNRNWSATFDWLIKDQNMAKVLEGNYDGRKNRASPKQDYSYLDNCRPAEPLKEGEGLDYF
ncbi:helix-turn-helix domain-containing protein [Jingyaoa shaoxingensis]|uniref:Helix-turn-helix domain-containing protein n=1 Tax=Jingyaoa shaoxingensis TaxID=2763671 RepID=A0ABR7NDU7_9FIRM|nr:helix-turn-helix domain-containing protein [Jingyaoa shaoxingensis]MBC8574469.1 hypothetical protein [Jingyaoa shaoxingensis]